LLVALLATGILRAQSPAQNQSQPKTPDLATPLPVPGGGAGLGPGGIPKPEDQHTPTIEETRRRIKEQGDQIADLQARRLASQLNLNEAQLNRVRAIFIDREDQLRKAVAPEAAASEPLTPQQRQLKIQEIKDAALKRLQMVLNPDQRQQFETMMAHSTAERARRAAIAQRSRAPIAGSTPAPAATQQAPAAPAAAPAPATPQQ
jgi:hypothetical protein